MNYYEVLGVDRKASQADIKKKWRELTLKYHPDTHKDDKEAEKKYKDINAAYEILGDPDARKKYDNELDGIGNFDFSFGDIFGGFNPFSRRSTSKPRPNKQIIMTDVSIVDAYLGKTIKVDYIHKVKCDECDGYGSADKKSHTCHECNGTGKKVVTTRQGNSVFQQITSCPTCHGTGTEITNPCRKCHGKGVIQINDTVNVELSPQTLNGTIIIVPNAGSYDVDLREAGDLGIGINLISDKNYYPSNNIYDIIYPLNVDYIDAILGRDITVKSIDGLRDLHAKIDSGTQSGKELSFINEGFQHGKLSVIVNVVIPSIDSITEKEKELLEEIKSIKSN